METAAQVRKFIVDNFYVPEPDELEAVLTVDA